MPRIEATAAAPPPVRSRDRADPCTMVIFGALGDLTRRKLMPAIYYLAEQNLLAEHFAVLGVAREKLSDKEFRERIHSELSSSDEIAKVDDRTWGWLSNRLFYATADFTNLDDFASIQAKLREIEDAMTSERNRIFYLAIPPSVFPSSVKNLAASELARRTPSSATLPWTRIVVEKPFGRSLETAQELNALLLDRFGEHQVYRIDHYLGKESVQNILVFRFANSIFEPLWNRQYISHIQITAGESIGVETRGRYYEEAGVLRDMFQNHLLQLLTLAAMEPPIAIEADAVRDEKVKVLRSVRPLLHGGEPAAVRAQYAAGTVDGESVPGYREEKDVSPTSSTPTFASLRVAIDNWRWKGVPFFLRSGKRLKQRSSEIVVQFKSPPHLMFGGAESEKMPPGLLVMRVQPREGIALRFQVKTPGTIHELTPGFEISPVEMDFSYSTAFGEAPSPAYETLLLDSMIGDATLFTRSDEVEMAWRVMDPLIKYWEEHPARDMPAYAAGTAGPAEADALIDKESRGARWI